MLADALAGGDAEHSLDDLLDAAGADSRAIDAVEVGAGYLAAVGVNWGVVGLNSASQLMMAPLAIEMHQDALRPLELCPNSRIAIGGCQREGSDECGLRCRSISKKSGDDLGIESCRQLGHKVQVSSVSVAN